ncbi:MAG: leucine-rich repeat protein, partial [Lachnospiraceae bacterium]|nr:leucine-rich repeat protein [Lachnospiraceae bacterium]
EATAGKPAASVTKAPEAKTLTYSGSAQELITVGEAEGGEMQYVLGTASKATEPYTTSIPTATDAGTYYVWYKAVGDASHEDSKPTCVTVTIKTAPSSGEVSGRGESKTTEELKEDNKDKTVATDSAAKEMGYSTMDTVIDALTNETTKKKLVEVSVEKGSATLAVESSGEVNVSLDSGSQTKADVLAAVLTPQEMVDGVTNNAKVDVTLEVADKDASSVGSDVAEGVQEKLAEGEQAYYFDADMFLSRNGGPREKITEWKTPIYLSMRIPQAIRQAGRLFRLIHTHKLLATGELQVRTYENEETDDPYSIFRFASNRLSTMAFAYSNVSSPTPTYAPSYSSGTTTSYSSSSSSSSGGGGGSGTESLTGGKNASKAYYEKIGKNTVEYLSPKLGKKAKTAVVPSKIKIGKKTYKVTAVSAYAFIGNDKLRTVRIGKNVKRLSPYAFAGCKKLTTIKVRSKKLTAKKIKNSLKDSSVDTVIILKKAEPKFRTYKKIFTQKITGAAGKLTVKRNKKSK